MDDLAKRICRFIENEADGSFETLILELFARQYEHNAAYRVFCDSLEISPQNVTDWRSIPAAPARAFKVSDLTCVSLEQVTQVFHSSGTTEGRHSRHYLDETAIRLYEISLKRGFDIAVPQSRSVIALMPPFKDAPHSSLSYMLETLKAEEFYWGDSVRLAERLDLACRVMEPVCVFGTAFALLELFDETSQSWRLPPGSRVIETGGFKGRTRQVTREELYYLIGERLGVSPPHALAEYGMSEMASQYYGSPGTGLKGGHWVRARIIDPITDDDDSDEGVLRHYDLANWNSVAVIQTEDMARWVGGERDRFELLGRAPLSELRGCSLSVEERWLQLV